jgi:hypothetical protein
MQEIPNTQRFSFFEVACSDREAHSQMFTRCKVKGHSGVRREVR